jgi:HEAT repeat protein
MQALAIVEALGAGAAWGQIPARLAELLSDEDQELRRASLAAVKSLGRLAAVPEVWAQLEKLLDDEDPALQLQGISVLEALRGPEIRTSYLEKLTDLLESQVAGLRLAAAKLLCTLGALAVPEMIERKHSVLFPKFSRLLHHHDVETRRCAALAVLGFGESAAERAEIITGFTGLLGDREMVSRPAFQAVSRKASERATAFWHRAARGELLDRWIALLADPQEEVARNAAAIVGLMARDSREVLDRLSERLTDSDARCRLGAAWALEQTGGAAAGDATTIASVVDRLAGLLEDEYVLVREAAMGAASRFRQAAVHDGFMKGVEILLAHPLPRFRRAAAHALRRLGFDAFQHCPQLIDRLIPFLTDPQDPAIREAALAAIPSAIASGGCRDGILDGVAQGLIAQKPSVRRRAAQVVAAVPDLGQESVLDRLYDLLAESDLSVRQAAVQALTRITPARARLVSLLTEHNFPVQRSAMKAIGQFDPARWGRNLVQQSAVEVLGQLDPAVVGRELVRQLLQLTNGFPPTGDLRGTVALTLEQLMKKGLRIVGGVPCLLQDESSVPRLRPLP